MHTEDDMREAKDTRRSLSSELHFYTISDLQKLLGWSEKTVKKLFNDPSFPAADFGTSSSDRTERNTRDTGNKKE